MKKIFISILTVLMVAGCSAAPVNNETEQEITTLPAKEKPDSMLMSDSPINPTNLDNYMFLEDTMYVDTRSPNQILEEGYIAGFLNIPFYEFLVSYKPTENILFSMSLKRDENGEMIANLGEVGSFTPTYEESEDIIKDLFPMDKNIVFISTAGVEAAYLMNLLVQLGYDGSKLYNAGTFSNGMGNIIAYRDYEDAKYYCEGTNVYSVTVNPNWGELTPIEEIQ